MTTSTATLAQRVADLPWPDLHTELDTRGFAQTPVVLDAEECERLAGLYDTGTFRATVNMGRLRYGQGEYRYFDHPLPPEVTELRRSLYAPLAETAARWAGRLGEEATYPTDHEAFLEICHRAGQRRPTPLLLRYGPGDWNALHQDIYGDVAFPLQAVTLLDRPGEDFTGGEFVLLEQRPRAQSRPHVENLRRGAFLVFATRHRPVPGRRGYHRGAMRHGVSTLAAGRRTTLGLIFHDAA
ncbi:MAG TPA: 2OG-Fe(II) oxygenase [Acidimicrobiales bacterium]|nr:2OG-Fe(II) oxygenase [Acidimicrobiales bacterium]